MKKYLLLFLVVLLPVFAQDKKAKEMTIVGRITDVKCHLNGMADDMGADHNPCAVDCIKGGLPVGLVDEKTSVIYVVVPAKGMKSANDEMVKYADAKVKLTGRLVEKGGLKMFLYTKVEQAL